MSLELFMNRSCLYTFNISHFFLISSACLPLPQKKCITQENSTPVWLGLKISCIVWSRVWELPLNGMSDPSCPICQLSDNRPVQNNDICYTRKPCSGFNRVSPDIRQNQLSENYLAGYWKSGLISYFEQKSGRISV